MNEVKIKVEEKQGKEGVVYRNINPKKALGYDQYIVIEKIYKAGNPGTYSKNGKTWTSYNTRVKYDGGEVSFFLDEKAHEIFESFGEPGTKLKLAKVEESFVNAKGEHITYDKIVFEQL